MYKVKTYLFVTIYMDEVKRDIDTIAKNNLNPWYPCTPISVGSLARITNPCVSRGVSSRRLNWSFTPENTNFSNQSQCSLALRVPLVHMRKICTLHLSWPSFAASWPFALSQRRILRFVRLFFFATVFVFVFFFFFFWIGLLGGWENMLKLLSGL